MRNLCEPHHGTAAADPPIAPVAKHRCFVFQMFQKARLKTRRRCTRSSTISLSVDSIQPCDACSSSMARRRCPRRSANHWTRCGDPALPNLQGAQHSGAVAQIDARFGAAGLAANPGNGRRRKGRNAHSQSRPPSRTGLVRRSPRRSWKGSTRCSLSRDLRRSHACTNIIENVMGTVRRVCRNVKYWRSPSMALRWAAAAMQEAARVSVDRRHTSICQVSALLSQSEANSRLPTNRLFKSSRLRRFQSATTAWRNSTDGGTSPDFSSRTEVSVHYANSRGDNRQSLSRYSRPRTGRGWGWGLMPGNCARGSARSHYFGLHSVRRVHEKDQ